MTTTTQVQIFVGEEITYGSERNFLARLRADLVRRGCAARIHANFITRRNQRQVDFLIATDHRLVQVELKTVDQTLPLIGGLNGPWAQELPGGQLRTLDRNFYRQAHDATFAVSDDMHDLARRGEVPGIAGKYFAQLHTVVCVNPDIPAGSRLDRYQHVDVVGYQQLLTLLTSDGPKPAWENEHWDAFTRHLQLIPQQPDDPEETSRRDIVALLSDYRRRFTATVERDLHEYVPLPAQTTEATAADPVLVLAEAMAGRHVATFTGPSGAGKSHAARHAALTLAASDGIPVWVRCGEYHRGRFSHALSRAVAPFTTDSGVALLRQAAQAGSPAAVILDGLNECAPADQAELLEQFDALRLRLPVAAVITSTTSIGLPNPDVELTALSPGDDTRAALLASYGHPDGLDGAEAFQTPMELALAAQCSDQVRHGATATELFDAYIGHACPAETTRAGLRRLAVEMDRQLRGSLTITEIRALLHRHADASTPAAGIDAVLNCSLLTLTQGRAAFTHERFARFLAAEHLVLHAGDTTALVAALRAPGHGDLPAHAIALETRANHRRELLLALADPPLLTAAVQGRFGSQTAPAIETEVVTSLDEATNATTEAQPIRDVGGPDDHFDFHWEMPTPRTGLQQALLIVAGRSLADGLFLHETARLLDATDHRCAQRMRQMREGGHRAAISAVVHATYSGISYSGDRELRKLAASVVINACELSHLPRRRRVVKPSPARAMWGDVTEPRPRWGRLTATLFLLHPDDPDDHALLPDVFIAAWAANGSILRFTALRTAMENARAAKGAVRDRMRAALDQCDTENIFLNSSLFEALAAYGGIDPLNTEDTIRAQIQEILAAPDDPDTRSAARGLVGMVFEDQNLHGPYSEVLAALDPADYLRLHVMAARSSDLHSHSAWIMNAIVECPDYVNDDACEALRQAVLTVDWDNLLQDEAVGAHLIALRGWATIADELPTPPHSDQSIANRAWRAIDEILFALLRNADPMSVELSAHWGELHGPCAPAAVDVLAHLRAAQMWEMNSGQPSMYQRLLTACPNQVRQLIEWAVPNRDQLAVTFRNGPTYNRLRGLVTDLGIVGTEDTTALLQSHISDDDIGDTAIAAIRAIKRRGTGP